MKQLFTLAAMMMLGTGLLQAQDGKEKGGRIEALKIGYLTKKLNLTPDEAQKFWPIYNNYASELKSVRTEMRQNSGSELESQEKVLSIRKKYNGEFARAIPSEKVNTLFQSEKEFNNYVQKELQERRQQRQTLR